MRNPIQYGGPQKGTVQMGKKYQTEESEVSVVIPGSYPLSTKATDVWHWGKASGDYPSEVLAQDYTAESGGTPGHEYGLPGPAGTGMNGIYWANTASLNSHHTAPSTVSNQSSGPVRAAHQMGTSNFQFYFLYRTLACVDQFYYIMDYDAQDTVSTFTPGIQFYYSKAGFYAPGSFACLLSDGPTNQTIWYVKSPGAIGYNDGKWMFIRWVFNRTLASPQFYLYGRSYPVIKAFAPTPLDLNAYGAINPVNGIRFAQKEVNDQTTGRADMVMAAAAYAKNLTYTWS